MINNHKTGYKKNKSVETPICSHIKTTKKQCLEIAKWNLILTSNSFPFFSCDNHLLAFLKRATYTVSLIGKTKVNKVGTFEEKAIKNPDSCIVSTDLNLHSIELDLSNAEIDDFISADPVDEKTETFFKEIELSFGDGELEDEYIAEGLEQAACMVDAFLFDYPFISVEVCLFDLAEKLRDEASMLKNSKFNADKIYFDNLYTDDQ